MPIRRRNASAMQSLQTSGPIWQLMKSVLDSLAAVPRTADVVLRSVM